VGIATLREYLATFKATLNKSHTARASPIRAHRGVANARHSYGYGCALRLALHPDCGRAHP